MTYFTYKITAPHTDKVYFGITKQHPTTRMGFHLQALTRGYHTNHEMQRAFDANPNDWTHTVLSSFKTWEAADAAETDLIRANAKIAFNVQKNPIKSSKSFRLVSAAVAAEILALRDDEYSYVIAEMFDVAQSTVSAIWRGVHWSSCNYTHATRHDLAAMAKNFMAQVNAQTSPVSAPI